MQVISRRSSDEVFGIGALILALLIPTFAIAQHDAEWHDWSLGGRFEISLNLFRPTLDTTLRLDATDGTTGTLIDFEQNLGFSDTDLLGLGTRYKVL